MQQRFANRQGGTTICQTDFNDDFGVFCNESIAEYVAIRTRQSDACKVIGQGTHARRTVFVKVLSHSSEL